MSRRTVLTAVSLICLTTAFGSRATADHRGRSSPAVDHIAALLDEGANEERPFAALSRDSSHFELVPEASHDTNDVMMKLFHANIGGGSRRTSKHTEEASAAAAAASQHQTLPESWPLLAEAVAVRDYQRRDDKPTSLRRKKLKSDVFYAVRGRRRSDSFDAEDEKTSSSSIKNRWWPSPMGSGPEFVDKDWLLTLESAGARGQGAGDKTATDERRQLELMAMDKALKMLNDEREHEADKGSRSWSTSKDKRDPPAGFHAIRGKRQIRQALLDM